MFIDAYLRGQSTKHAGSKKHLQQEMNKAQSHIFAIINNVYKIISVIILFK